MLERLLNKKLYENPELEEMRKDLYLTLYMCRKQINPDEIYEYIFYVLFLLQMETINDVLHYLNFLDFVGDLKSDDYSNFIHTKKVLKDDFQYVDSEQLIHMLGVINDLRILFLRQDYHDVDLITESLRGKIFILYEKK